METPRAIAPYEEQLALVKGKVQDGFFKPGLVAVKSTGLLHRVTDIMESNGANILFEPTSYYISDQVEGWSAKSIRAHSQVVAFLQKELNCESHRFAVCIDDEPKLFLCQELLHDFILSRPLKERQALLHTAERHNKDPPFETKEGGVYNPSLIFLMGNICGVHHVKRIDTIADFASVFFAGLWGKRSDELWNERTNDAEFIRDNAPEQVKRAFKNFGLIWPKEGGMSSNGSFK